jgi:pSer/pThr/pTyr-binding forkhead associated (FHA) protein
MKARLIERGADEKHTREIPITQTELLIGRGADCDLRLPVPDVSRHHCIVRVGTDEALVVDLGSSNGTYLNGERVRSQATLHSGDLLSVGECQFVVDLGDLGWADLGVDTVSDPQAATIRRQPRPAKPTSEKEAGRSPGEASGPGGLPGKEPG